MEDQRGKNPGSELRFWSHALDSRAEGKREGAQPRWTHHRATLLGKGLQARSLAPFRQEDIQPPIGPMALDTRGGQRLPKAEPIPPRWDGRILACLGDSPSKAAMLSSLTSPWWVTRRACLNFRFVSLRRRAREGKIKQPGGVTELLILLSDPWDRDGR